MHKNLRRILKIQWPQWVTNEEVHVKRRDDLEMISIVIKRILWKWMGVY